MAKVVPGPPYPGVYQHYKGDIYIVHKIITDSTNNRPGRITDGRIMVFYESLELKEFHVREIQEFNEHVHDDGSPSHEHHFYADIPGCEECVPRFKLMDLAPKDDG